jgi:Terminase RNaseH-like domain
MSKQVKEVSGINRDVFLAFCSRLLIPSKEGDYAGTGETLVPLIPMRTQVYLLDEILEGLNRGIHFFVVLKCRQSGVTTLGLAFDLYWCFRHDGVILNFIADIGSRTAYNRSLLKDFIRSLSKHPEWRQEVDDDNRNMISFGNRSKIIWNSANTRDEGGLGVGTGVMCCHGTEVGRYKDEEGLSSLMSSLSTRNPNRFYLFESTAHGPNLFREMCDEAAEPGNTSQKFIFIGWWLQPDYDLDLKVEEHRQRFRTYWETFPRPDQEEVVWVDTVKRRYGWEITPTQLGWWRYHLKELKFQNLELMYQEYPPLPEYAWRYGGHTFINGNKLIERRILAEKRQTGARYFQFEFSDNFEETSVHEVDPRSQWYDLITWDEPRTGRGVRYCIGVDPAHGASEEGDHACIQVWRCYSDKAVQVAEFVRRELPTYHLAWAILHLAGTYNSETLLNVELQGGGFAVMEHIQRLQREQEIRYNPALARYFENLSHYVYYRPDAVRRAFGSFHWRTTPDSKDRMLSCFRDFFEQGVAEIRSIDLIKEVEKMQRLKDGTIETGKEDHRIMATCVMVMAYIQCLETDLGGTQFTEEYYKQEQKGIDGQVTQSEVVTAQILNWRARAIALDNAAQAAKKAPRWARGR